MKRIGLLSDTHSHLDDGIWRHFEECDEIWHAGDFGDIRVLRQLQAFKPLRGVYGNIDGADIRAEVPLEQRFMCEEIPVFMVHIGGYPGKYAPAVKASLLAQPPKGGLFISGHSHILKVMMDKKLGFLHLNPGACGNEGWHRVKTLLRFSIEGANISNLEIIELGSKGIFRGKENMR